MINLEKLNRNSASPPPPFKKTCPCKKKGEGVRNMIINNTIIKTFAKHPTKLPAPAIGRSSSALLGDKLPNFR